MPVMPSHAKRLNEKMLKLIKGVQSADALRQSNAPNYVDLHLTFEECDKKDENIDQNNFVPPIRYFFF